MFFISNHVIDLLSIKLQNVSPAIFFLIPVTYQQMAMLHQTYLVSGGDSDSEAAHWIWGGFVILFFGFFPPLSCDEPVAKSNLSPPLLSKNTSVIKSLNNSMML